MKAILYLVSGLFLLVSCGSAAPVADAGSNQTIILGATVTLDGTNSIPKNTKTPTYLWTITDAPTGSTATLDDSTAPLTTFTPDLVGAYTVQLIINNGDEDSEPAQVTITVLPVGGTILPEAIVTDPTGEVSLYELVAIENSRNATQVNFSLQYTIENSGVDLVNIGFVVYGVNAQSADVFTQEIKTAIGANEYRVATVSFGDALTITEYDSIVSWEVDPIIIY